MKHNNRPWGNYRVLDDITTHKVKQIEVASDECLSKHYHHNSSEIWTIVSGICRITLNGIVKNYLIEEVARFPQSVKCRIENPTNISLVSIEANYCAYFGEDDIVKILDDYSRD